MGWKPSSGTRCNGGRRIRKATAIAEPAVQDAVFRPLGRVAVFQPRPGMGDLIWHLPHIRAIAAASRDKRVTLITKPSTQAAVLLRHDPAIERIVWFDRNPRQGRGRHDGPLGYPRLVATLRRCRSETCVILHHGASLAAAAWLAGIQHRYGYGYGWQRLWLNHGPFLGSEVRFAEAFDQARAFTSAAGWATLPEPALWVDPAAMVRLDARTQGMPRPIAVLGVGCHGADRQWGAVRFAGLAAYLRQHGFATVLLLVAADEADLATSICRQLADASGVDAAIGWPLDEVVALLSASSLFIGNDSGLMNVRAAVGRIAYALFGASGPLAHSRMIRPIVPPQGARTGMTGITLDQIVAALQAHEASDRT